MMLIVEVTTPALTRLTRPETVPSRSGPVKTTLIITVMMAADAWLEFVSLNCYSAFIFSNIGDYHISFTNLHG